MRLRSVIPAVVLVAGCVHHRERPLDDATPATPEAVERARADVRRIAAEYLERLFTFYPEYATAVGWPGADHGAVYDRSLEALAAFQREEDRLAEALRRIAPGPLAGTPEWVSHGIVLHALEGSRALRPCRLELWPVSSIGGWQNMYSTQAATQPLGTPALADAAARRLSGIARQVDVELGVVREGVRLGYVATSDNVRRAIRELDALLATAPGRWPFVERARKASDAALVARLTRLVADELVPATRRYRDYLAEEYLPKARQAIGVSALPGGAACYRGAVLDSVGLDLSPDDLHALGLAKLAELRREMQEVGRRSFGSGDVDALLDRFREAPTFASSDEVIATANAAVARAEAQLPRWFGRLPKARVTVQPYPAFLSGSDLVERYTPQVGGDGTLSGIYFVNAFDPTRKPRVELESTSFHEALPGHHLQSAIALEATDRPEASRYLFSSAFGEGWALYAERLADEMGLFSSDLDRLGLLASEAFRAARLVVDTGIHAKGWTRRQAVDFLHANSVLPRGVVESEIDRYVVWPGQATSYMVGAIEIRRLRERAREQLGDRFDIRAFHDVVLEDGAVTLPMLGTKVDDWVRRQGRDGGAPVTSAR